MISSACWDGMHRFCVNAHGRWGWCECVCHGHATRGDTPESKEAAL